MIIAIDPLCRKCNRNDPRYVEVDGWDKVKPLLVVRDGWKCPHCGCISAIWYTHRCVVRENVPVKDKLAIEETQSKWQCFSITSDEVFTQHLEFQPDLRDLETREKL